MRYQIIKMATAVIVSANLVGCAGMKGSFGCDKTANGSCTPVSQVQAKADSGYYAHLSSGGDHPETVSTEYSYENTTTSGLSSLEPSTGAPVRSSERVQRIWIAPYQDKSNSYHGSSAVYSVLEHSHWVGRPVKEIKLAETEQDD
jgi:type IV conjugative transfer system lipoprotein TraV